ncbi:hypothetical protein N9412_00235 [bacterium]|nr:hypothetical protein [bacterium]
MLNLIQDLKSKSKKAAFGKKFPIIDSSHEIVGSLVPVGDWIFNDVIILHEIIAWRTKFNKMFPTRAIVTKEGTRKFIKESYVRNTAAIFFLIYTKDEKLIGHIGLSRLDQSEFELVNLIRGASGGSADLVYHAEATLISLGFQVAESQSCFVEVMSYNWPVKDLHASVGFEISESFPLLKIASKDSVTHKKVCYGEENVKYTIQVMSLPKKSSKWNTNIRVLNTNHLL